MKDDFTKRWIIDNSIDIVGQYEKGILTIRALHYQLVGLGMTNDIQHYKRVVNAMEQARWDGLIPFETFSDLDREMVGSTASEETDLDESINIAKRQIEAWMTYYTKNRWENQVYYPEVFIEKKALQGVFQRKCIDWDIAMGPCKGYPSLTFLHKAYERFFEATNAGKRPIILYFGDYDPSGEDIPRSISENLSRFGVSVEVRRIALMREQVESWSLPPAPTKVTDSRTGKWDGLGQVELDAVRPEKLMFLLEEAITEIFDHDRYNNLLEIMSAETEQYRKELKAFIHEL